MFTAHKTVFFIQTPSIALPCLDTLTCTVGYGFIQAMLAPHATVPEARGGAGMTEADVSFAFLAMGVFYVGIVPIASK